MPTQSQPPIASAKPSDLFVRLISGVGVIAVTLLFAYAGGWLYTVFVVAVIFATALEIHRLLQDAGYRSAISTVLLAAVAGFVGIRWPQWMILALALSAVLLATLAWQLRQTQGRRFGDWASSFAAGLYLGWTGGHLAELREVPNGLAWTALMLASVWLADSGAYVVGRLFGRHKLSPRISPGKTWEGYVGGVVLSTLAGTAVGTFSPIGWMVGAAAGFLVGALSVLGDLIESMIKREAHVKDSGRLIPGHGGVFDRIDSLLWAAVIVFYVWVFVSSFGSIF